MQQCIVACLLKSLVTNAVWLENESITRNGNYKQPVIFFGCFNQQNKGFSTLHPPTHPHVNHAQYLEHKLKCVIIIKICFGRINKRKPFSLQNIKIVLEYTSTPILLHRQPFPIYNPIHHSNVHKHANMKGKQGVLLL